MKKRRHNFCVCSFAFGD